MQLKDSYITFRDYIEKCFSTSISNRKVLQITIREEQATFHPRPQHYTIYISPFGTGKTGSFLKVIKDLLKNDALLPDRFTTPSLLGTIGKDRNFVKGILFDAGGKVILIDEWNEIPYDVQTSLLSVMETQYVERTLGFSSLKPYVSDKKNRFSSLRVEENRIYGKCQFTIIAFAMYFTLTTKKMYALFSRFSPIFHNPSEEEVNDMLRGENSFVFVDVSKLIENVVVENDVWGSFIERAYAYLKQKNIYPKGDEQGFYTRACSDALRFAVNSSLKELREDEKPKELSIDLQNLLNQLPFLEYQLAMYQHPKTQFQEFCYLKEKFPDENAEFYARALKTSENMVWKLEYLYKKRSLPSLPEKTM